MAYEVFVNYRREDTGGHARALESYLRSKLGDESIFFDRTDITPGTFLPDRIKLAAQASAVMLVLIGPDWLTKLAQRRKMGAIDYVHEEILIALKHGKHIIPVIFDDSNWHKEASNDLPDDIKELAEYASRAIGGSTSEFDAQREQLVEMLCKHLNWPLPQLSKPNFGRSGCITPENLPYLCDRAPQATLVQDVLRAHISDGNKRRPLVIVVHGDARERHDALVDRLHRLAIPRTFEELQLNLRPRLLHCNQALPVNGNITEFESHFLSQMADELRMPKFNSHQELINCLEKLEPQGAIMVFSWLSSECRRQPATAIASFLRCWAAMPNFGGKGPLICFLCLKYDDLPTRFGRFLRRARAGLFASSQGKIHPLARAVDQLEKANEFAGKIFIRTLPKLEPVTAADLTRWADDARKHTGNLRISNDRVRQVLAGKEQRTMDDVLAGLDSLLRTPP